MMVNRLLTCTLMLLLLFQTSALLMAIPAAATNDVQIKKDIFVKRGYVVIKESIFSPKLRELSFPLPYDKGYRLLYLYPSHPERTGVKVMIKDDKYTVILPPTASNATIYKIVMGAITVDRLGKANLTLPLSLAPLKSPSNTTVTIHLPSKPSRCFLTSFNETLKVSNSTVTFNVMAKPGASSNFSALSFDAEGPAWIICEGLEREVFIEGDKAIFTDKYVFVNYGWGEGSSLTLTLPPGCKVLGVSGSLWEYREGLSHGGYFIEEKNNTTELKVYLMAPPNPGDKAHLEVKYEVRGVRGAIPLHYYIGYPVAKAKGVLELKGTIERAVGANKIVKVDHLSKAIYEKLVLYYNNTGDYLVKVKYSLYTAPDYLSYAKGILVLLVIATPLAMYLVRRGRREVTPPPEALVEDELVNDALEYYERRVELLEEIVEEADKVVKGEVARNAYRLWRKKVEDELKYLDERYSRDLKRLTSMSPEYGRLLRRLKEVGREYERLTYQIEALAYEAMRGAVTRRSYEKRSLDIVKRRERVKDDIFRLLSRLKELRQSA